MRYNWLPAVCFLSAFLLIPSPATANLNTDIEISYKKFVLKNGLTLVIHEDHKTPIVAVNIWYHVGSKNEKPGKTGFAHLFEHLMFNGSEHFNDDYFKAVEKVGATDLNGTTSEDRTNYFQNAPKEALDFLLWLESDRMGHLLGAIDQAKLDEQRGVVQNEKRQRENQPYGLADELITKGTYPPGHPYSWTVIGSMEDLNAASLVDVKEWFNTYYGAANATLVVAGDVKAEEVLEKVEKHFGSIPSGPTITKHENWAVKRSGSRREIAQDRVPQSRIYKVWTVPAFGEKELDHLNLVSDVLASGKNSRFYKRLVYEDQIASTVSAFIDVSEIGSRFYVEATARPGESLARIEKALDEELARFLAKGPTSEELERVKTQQLSSFIRGIERIGGFGGKSDILAMNQTYAGSPDFYKTTLANVRNATMHDLQSAGKNWLSDGSYILEIHPFPRYETSKTDVDRSKLPIPAITPDVKFPKLQRTNLSSGLKVVLAERRGAPLVNLTLQVDAGYAADQFASPGTARLAMNMLDEGTKKRTSLQISDELDRLGASLTTGSDLDTSVVSLSALKPNLDPSLDIFADVILNPAFPAADFERLKKEQLDSIQREKSEPSNMALRILPELLYGEKHAYNTPFTGSGKTEAVMKLTREDAEAFYRTWFKPGNATLIVAGDTSLSEIVPKLEKLFATWPGGSVPKKNFADVERPAKQVLYLLDRPGSIQSIIFAGHLAPPKSNPDEIAIETMNNILGGTFTSRINMNLREDKHWSYGARCSLVPARAQRPFLVMAPVQTDKTKESIVEINKELAGLIGKQPVTPDELTKAQKNQTLKLPGTWETVARIESSVSEITRFGLPDDYFETYPQKVLTLNTTVLQSTAAKVLHPSQLTWVIVGDRSKVESGLRELGFGEIRLIDADGKTVQ